jgi:type IV pilus assembly protein PilB
MEVTPNLKQMIASGKTATEIGNQALAEGMITLRRSGLIKIRNGLTTIDEVLSETV